jgi:prepilin-type N-terminal cleavage/methylation domain-containing protein
MERKKGFTLIELLVVIAVIALLLSILVPALRMARDQVKRLYCANNIKQILFGLLAYGNENRNSIPMDPGVPDWHYPNAGYWPWDISYYITNEIQKGFGVNIQDLNLKSGQDMPIQPIFYCPANMAQKRNRALYWSYAIDPDTHAGYRILGYLFLWYASWNNDGKGRILGTEEIGRAHV